MSDLISREALIKLLKDYGHSGDDDYIVEAVNTIPRIANAPVVSSEPIGYISSRTLHNLNNNPEEIDGYGISREKLLPSDVAVFVKNEES